MSPTTTLLLRPRTVLAAWAICMSAFMSGCGSTGTMQAPLRSGQQPVAPRAFDLRFQQVDAPTTSSGYLPHILSNVEGGVIQTFDDNIGTGLSVGDDCNAPTGNPLDCAWIFSTFFLPVGQSGLSMTYQTSNAFANLAIDLDALALPNTVITSIQLVPPSDTYAISSIQTTQTTGFKLMHLTVAPTDIGSTVASQGLQSRVITALSFNAGQVELFAYGWQADTTTLYDTRVASVTLSNVGAQASSLAAAGYIITAAGGDPADGFLMIGTKRHGDTMPRPFVIEASNDPNGSGKLSSNGYAIVGFFFSAANGGTWTYLGEK